MLNESFFIMEEVHRSRISVKKEDRGERLAIFEHTCVLHKLIVEINWCEWLACEVEDVSLLEMMQKHVIKDEQNVLIFALLSSLQC